MFPVLHCQNSALKISLVGGCSLFAVPQDFNRNLTTAQWHHRYYLFRMRKDSNGKTKLRHLVVVFSPNLHNTLFYKRLKKVVNFRVFRHRLIIESEYAKYKQVFVLYFQTVFNK
jgi:hypothetical protein